MILRGIQRVHWCELESHCTQGFSFSFGFLCSCGLVKVTLIVGKEWMEIANQSEFMQGSFRRHQWRAALLICLTQPTQGFVPKLTDMILKEIRELMDTTTGFYCSCQREKWFQWQSSHIPYFFFAHCRTLL
ncbi:hypothetical protein JVT61DRAFT_1659 [Boletus reticuloceps]|uniref:Uncharacterized protein n=1 Tax=Boletus reticuloceps TaxID=495285 RepID=A0A8I2YR33_9AGAM|nr:hypothetical protein JVT61DRAFT_1659 [Boletus reticuloceps]